jgi:subtilase family serine protease
MKTGKIVLSLLLVPALAAADVVVGLRGRDDAGLARLVAAQRTPTDAATGRWLTPAEFTARYGAPASAVRRVSRWLRSSGCAVQRLPGRQFVRCRHRVPGNVPGALRSLVDGMVDPSRLELVQRSPVARPESAAGNGAFYFSPTEFARTYGLDRGAAAGLDGRGVMIGLLAASQMATEDLAAFRTRFGLPPADFVQSSGPRTGDVGEVEAVLDTTWAGAVAPAARLFLAVSQDIQEAYDLLIASNTPDVISSSLDICPPTRRVRGQANRLLARVLRQAAVQGQTVLIASGDTGPHECSDGGFGLLASSPLVTAVGGTTPMPVLDANGMATGYGSESVWNGGTVSSGGGRTILRRPSYQRGGSKRTIPDVAFPAAGVYPIIVRGQRLLVGGTSAAAPAWAGVIARLVQQEGRRVGFVNPRLYEIGRAQRHGGAAVFHDVVVGNNGTTGNRGFPAKPGYDLATGWGSVDAAALLDVFSGP